MKNRNIAKKVIEPNGYLDEHNTPRAEILRGRITKKQKE